MSSMAKKKHVEGNTACNNSKLNSYIIKTLFYLIKRNNYIKFKVYIFIPINICIFYNTYNLCLRIKETYSYKQHVLIIKNNDA